MASITFLFLRRTVVILWLIMWHIPFFPRKNISISCTGFISFHLHTNYLKKEIICPFFQFLKLLFLSNPEGNYLLFFLNLIDAVPLDCHQNDMSIFNYYFFKIFKIIFKIKNIFLYF